MHDLEAIQCDFWKFLGDKLTHKSSQVAILRSIPSKFKLLWLAFGQFLEKFRVLFISTSGHTEALDDF